jgi:hypothetical protein
MIDFSLFCLCTECAQSSNFSYVKRGEYINVCLYAIGSVFFSYVYMHFLRVDCENMIESIRSTQRYSLILRMIVVKCAAVLLRGRRVSIWVRQYDSKEKEEKRCGKKRSACLH